MQSFTSDPLAIASYRPLYASDGRTVVVQAARLLKDSMLVCRIEGIADRTNAEALTHQELLVERSSLPPPDDDEFYVADLVGCRVQDETGTAVGTVIAVPNYGGGDLVEVQPPSGGETLLFPFTKAVVPAIDLAARTIIIAAPEVVEDDRPRDDKTALADRSQARNGS